MADDTPQVVADLIASIPPSQVQKLYKAGASAAKISMTTTGVTPT